jgi:hypothetical protein
MNGNRADDLFKVGQKGVFETYLEVHSLRRARTSAPE